MRAWAWRARASSASTNFSNSARAREPISLQGPRCSASSMTPDEISQESACPWKWSIWSPLTLHRDLDAIHLLDLVAQIAANQIAFEFAIRSEQAIFDGECFLAKVKRPHLLIVRELRIHGVNGGLRLLTGDVAGNDRGKIAFAVSHQHHLGCAGQLLQDLFFNGFGRDVMAGAENNQILDAAHDAPVPARVDFALVSGVEPTIAQRLGSFLGTVPVAGKNVG